MMSCALDRKKEWHLGDHREWCYSSVLAVQVRLGGDLKVVTKRKSLPKLQTWIDARKRFRLSHCQIQMAREPPKNFGSLANHDQGPWKEPLGKFIEHLYFKRFQERSTGHRAHFRRQPETSKGEKRPEKNRPIIAIA